MVKQFLLLLGSLFIIGLSVIESASAVTPNQLNMLMNMSPDQQQQILNMAGKRGLSPTGIRKPKVEEAVNNKLDADKDNREQQLVEEPEIVTLGPGDSIIISFKFADDDIAKQIKPENIYIPKQPKTLLTLDREGFIFIPGLGRIELSGLNEEQAAARINIEPLLQSYKISVLRLPYKDNALSELKPYGYELFRQDPSTLRPDTYIPVPDSYLVGPGDQIHIQLIGKDNNEYLLEVSRDSTLSIPGLGSFPVSGLTFDELKRDLLKRVKRQLIGVEAFITMGELRSIQVFVLGEVEQPGAYSVNALATMTQALMYSRGINEMGSLRNISLKRKGKIIGKLDLYELLNEGNTANDLRLKPGDVVHVPAKINTVSVLGSVARPSIYELKKEKQLSQVLSLAGNALPNTDFNAVHVERVEDNENKLLTLDLSTETGKKFTVQNGDIITLNEVLERQQNVVHLKGEVLKPGKYSWRPNLRISQVIPNLKILKPEADPEYIVVKRVDPKGYEVSVESVSIRKALQGENSEDNILLQPMDEIYVVSHDKNRLLQIKPVINELIKYSDSGEAIPVVKISGQVEGPGRYPLEKNMRVADLVNASGRLMESAYILEAELTRFNTSQGSDRNIEHIKINLANALAGDKKDNILLKSHDLLNIKEIPLWKEDEIVQLYGEVRFPGSYAIRRGESLKQLLARAGGVTQYAYPEGAVFIRADLKKREQERLDTMARNLESELAAIALSRSADPTQVTDLSSANGLLNQLKGAEAAGRLVIDLKALLDESNEGAIILRDGDELFIPSQMQEVSVIGQVYHSTSHLHKDGLSVENYVDLSGGMTNKADEDNVYVIRSNGAVQAAKNGWDEDELLIHPGDTIIVPLDADRISNLKLWTSISQIVYQLGLSAAAWNTVGIFK